MSGNPDRMLEILRAHQAAFLDGVDVDSPVMLKAMAARVPGLKVDEIFYAAIYFQ